MTAADGRRSTGPVPPPAAVLLCSDVAQPGPLSAEMIGAALRRYAPGVRVLVVQDLCSRFSGLLAAVQGLGTGRVVVGCRQGNARRQRITGILREAGAHRAGAQVVDLLPGERAGSHDVAEQTVARLRAALARVSCADLTAPVREATSPLERVRFSRRNLFSLGYLAHHPVAAWTGDRCAGRGVARPCVQACPRQALSRAGPGISVDRASCTGCGACVAACRSGAMSLSGSSMAELEAAADTLVDDARRLGLGVAIVCSAAITEMPVGGPWLVLEVPSLEMVTAGWVLQVVAAGDRVTLVGCGEKACAGRGREMSLLSAEVVDQVAPGRRHLVVGPGDRLPACLGAAGAPGGAPRDQSGPPVRLHEPEATVQAISRLSDGPGSPWRLESPVAPLGEIAVDAARCSACACCVPACPTGAISAPSAPGGGAFVLTFDPSACPACGACVPSCPERAVSLRRAVSSATLASGRRTLVELARADRCPSCGKPRPGRHAAHVVAAKLAGSHPEIASRLQGEDRCADCLLTVRVEEVLGAEG